MKYFCVWGTVGTTINDKFYHLICSVITHYSRATNGPVVYPTHKCTYLNKCRIVQNVLRRQTTLWFPNSNKHNSRIDDAYKITNRKNSRKPVVSLTTTTTFLYSQQIYNIRKCFWVFKRALPHNTQDAEIRFYALHPFRIIYNFVHPYSSPPYSLWKVFRSADEIEFFFCSSFSRVEIGRK